MLLYTIITLLYDLASSQKCKTLLIKVIERNTQYKMGPYEGFYCNKYSVL